MSKKVGFISYRFAGTDGVTLESLKLVDVFTNLNFLSYYCSGESSMSEAHSKVFPEMHFNHPEILDITKRCFSNDIRSNVLTAELHNMRRTIKKQLYTFINSFHIDMLCIQNVLAIPMNIPFSMALVEVIAETKIPTIAHHHDFYWERERYSVNCIQDILKGCFPPDLTNITHVVINSNAQRQLGYRYGVPSVIIPNVMDFENPPIGKDSYNESIRKDLGISEDSLLLLQPTRIVQRKGIEHTIELARRLGDKTVVIISHESGDEGGEYKNRVLDFAQMLDVDVRLVAEYIGEERGKRSDGSKLYNLNDIYSCADLVTYPSLVEGFGNALLETFYFKKPVIVNQYSVYVADIKTKGFEAIEFRNFISKKDVESVKWLLNHPLEVEERVEKNYQLSLRYFSFRLLYNKLHEITQSFFGV